MTDESTTKIAKTPQAIGHRGYNALFPENSMAAFRAAIEAGAHGIETDLHLSKDRVVVLSHDPTLKRCFGLATKVAECDWDELSRLRTLREPKEPLARLVDLMQYISEPGKEHVWLLLDIKRNDDANLLCASLATTIASVPAASRPWNERIILAAWRAEWVAACQKHLPGFPVALTTPFPTYATAMLQVPDLHFSLFNYTFATRRGIQFRRRAREHARKIFSWSDNHEEWMAASIRNEVDGVITDDPKRFLELCTRWQVDGMQTAGKMTLKQMVLWVVVNFVVIVWEMLSALKHGPPGRHIRKALEGS
ncbi:PLC-like phosphodiesterase [Aspergillus egyptiacus]|nr:PLC-like phosphodiesterase [Aspergillus egyptiacus]